MPGKGGCWRGLPGVGIRVPFAQEGGRSQASHGETRGSLDSGLGGNSRLGAAVQRAPHLLSQLVSCPRPLGLAPSWSVFRCSSPTWRNQSTHPIAAGKSIPARPASPLWASLSRALLRVPLGTRTPLLIGVTASPRPCDHPALHRHKPVEGPVSQTRLR